MHAFPKTVRLHHKHDFRRTLDQGAKAVGSIMVLFLQPRAADADAPADGGTRMGLIVSRKVGNAVVRNRVKRHLREAFRQLRPELAQFSALWPMDLVVVARSGAAQASSADVANALQQGLRRLKRQTES